MKIKTINREYTSEYKNLNSKFIGILLPFRDKTLLSELILKYRKLYPKANHICYAYRIGYEKEEFRANDDGEPAGSAGKPILNQLYSFGAQNCILLVIRYFGGTKLGVAGLIDAYKTAAKNCLDIAEWIEEEEVEIKKIELSTETYYSIIKILKNNDIKIVSQFFSEGKYSLKIELPKSRMSEFDQILKSIII